MKTFFSLVLLPFFLHLLHSQPNELPYEVPAGWTHIAEINNTINDRQFIGVINDTIIFRYRFSPDAGKTWDTLIPAPELGEDYALLEAFYANSTRKFRIVYHYAKDSGLVSYLLKVSSDLGRSYPEVYPIDSAAWSMFAAAALKQPIFNPLRPEVMVVPVQKGSGSFQVEYALRSNDGGRSWKLVDVPGPVGGYSTDLDLIFDHRDADRWYIRAVGTGHDGAKKRYQTLDDGQTFQEVAFWPGDTDYLGRAYAGISAPGVFRAAWIERVPGSHPLYRQNQAIGAVDINLYGDTVRRMNWLEAVEPGLPHSNFDSSYIHNIVQSNYIIYNDRPSTAILGTHQARWKKNTDTIIYRSSKLYRTEDDGNTWKEIYSAPTATDILFLDPITRKLWLLAAYGSTSVWERFDLWSHQVVTSVDEQNTDIRSSEIYPAPASDHVIVRIDNPLSEPVTISLYSLTGQKTAVLYSGEVIKGGIVCYFPPELSSGTYFIHIDSLSRTYKESKAILILR